MENGLWEHLTLPREPWCSLLCGIADEDDAEAATDGHAVPDDEQTDVYDAAASRSHGCPFGSQTQLDWWQTALAAPGVRRDGAIYARGGARHELRGEAAAVRWDQQAHLEQSDEGDPTRRRAAARNSRSIPGSRAITPPRYHPQSYHFPTLVDIVPQVVKIIKTNMPSLGHGSDEIEVKPPPRSLYFASASA